MGIATPILAAGFGGGAVLPPLLELAAVYAAAGKARLLRHRDGNRPDLSRVRDKFLTDHALLLENAH